LVGVGFEIKKNKNECDGEGGTKNKQVYFTCFWFIIKLENKRI